MPDSDPSIPLMKGALSSALIFAALFAVGAFFFFFFTTLLVGGDGSAPWITHFAERILNFTRGLIGVSYKRSLLPVVLFWSICVFIVVFLVRLFCLDRTGHDRGK